MDKPSQSTGPEDTPKRSRWDMTPVISRDTNSAIRKSEKPSLGSLEKTPVRPGMTPSRFS